MASPVSCSWALETEGTFQRIRNVESAVVIPALLLTLGSSRCICATPLCAPSGVLAAGQKNVTQAGLLVGLRDQFMVSTLTDWLLHPNSISRAGVPAQIAQAP